MKKVEAYLSKDGKLFLDESTCVHHERLKKLKTVITDSSLAGNRSTQNFCDFLSANKVHILSYYFGDVEDWYFNNDSEVVITLRSKI